MVYSIQEGRGMPCQKWNTMSVFLRVNGKPCSRWFPGVPPQLNSSCTLISYWLLMRLAGAVERAKQRSHSSFMFTRKRFIPFDNCILKKGLQAALGRKKRETPPVAPKITGEVEAKIIALSCSSPPPGRSKWSLRLLADKAVELQYIDSISHEAVGRLLKKRTKTSSS